MTIVSINPCTGKAIKEYPQDSDEVIQHRIQAAKDAVTVLDEAGMAQRREWMLATADLLESELDEVARMITEEMGKRLEEAEAEVRKSAYAMRFYAEKAEEFLAESELADPSVVNASRARTIYRPLGVVLAVMPWNFPIWQVIRFAAPALMAGNTGLLKHASNVPGSSRYLGDLFTRGGFPEGAFASLLIGSSKVEGIIRDDRVAAVTLTGSEPAGRAVAAAAADVVKKSVLELGGSDPFIVMPSADIPAAVEVAVKARFSNNGQACINGKRFIVHSDVYDEFATQFAARIEAFRVGDPMAPDTDLGPVVDAAAVKELDELIQDAVRLGGRVVTGGSPVEDLDGSFYAPTLVADLTPEMKLWSEEAFGPVASIYRVESLEEAIALANDSPFGLGSAIWSQDENEIAVAEREIEAGAVFVNGMTISYPELPFGGIKRSGFGRELAAEGIREFCNLKTIWTA